MAGSEATAATKKDIARDKYYRKHYGISLAEYNVLAQDGCGICGYIPQSGQQALAVDHNHLYDRVKIQVFRVSKEQDWEALAEIDGKRFYHAAGTRAEARNDVKKQLRRASLRGILCWRHNKGLQYFQDNPEILIYAARYLMKLPKPPKNSLTNLQECDTIQ